MSTLPPTTASAPLTSTPTVDVGDLNSGDEDMEKGGPTPGNEEGNEEEEEEEEEIEGNRETELEIAEAESAGSMMMFAVLLMGAAVVLFTARHLWMYTTHRTHYTLYTVLCTLH